MDYEEVRKRAKELNSDGCSGVADFYIDCCYLHDILYRTGKDIDGKPVTRAEADAALRKCIQERSRFGRLNLMSWWRWIGLRLLGGHAWKGQ